jgi:hypothetical protein
VIFCDVCKTHTSTMILYFVHLSLKSFSILQSPTTGDTNRFDIFGIVLIESYILSR